MEPSIISFVISIINRTKCKIKSILRRRRVSRKRNTIRNSHATNTRNKSCNSDVSVDFHKKKRKVNKSSTNRNIIITSEEITWQLWKRKKKTKKRRKVQMFTTSEQECMVPPYPHLLVNQISNNYPPIETLENRCS